MRAKDAYTYIVNTPSQYTSVELISHKKEIGTNQVMTTTEVQLKKAKQRAETVIDDEGFTMTKKRWVIYRSGIWLSNSDRILTF